MADRPTYTRAVQSGALSPHDVGDLALHPLDHATSPTPSVSGTVVYCVCACGLQRRVSREDWDAEVARREGWEMREAPEPSAAPTAGCCRFAGELCRLAATHIVEQYTPRTSQPPDWGDWRVMNVHGMVPAREPEYCEGHALTVRTAQAMADRDAASRDKYGV